MKDTKPMQKMVRGLGHHAV